MAVQDIKNSYIKKGEGYPLILLHGNGEDSTYFEPQIEFFSRYFTVYAIDSRGHGDTARGEKPFTIRQFARDLKVFMDEQKIEKAHIFGFSDGANVAMIFAMKNPDRVEKLILNGGNLDIKGIKEPYRHYILEDHRRLSRKKNLSENDRRRYELNKLMADDPNIKDEELLNIKADTLVIAGTDDMIVREETDRIAAGIPSAELKILNGTHFVSREDPDTFDEAVYRFLTKEPVF